MAAIEKDTRQYLGEVGIALDYVGWADTFTFDPAVQAAINRVYTASVDRKVAEALGPYVNTIQALALASALRDKFDGKLPSTLSLTFLPQGMTDALAGLAKGLGQVPAAAEAQPK